MAKSRLPDLPALPKAVFVTGATGFIGQRLVAALLKNGHRVQTMVRPENTPDRRLPQACEQVAVDLTDVKKLRSIVAESSAVIYCAGSVRGRNSADFAKANVHGVRAMLDALEQSDQAPPMLLLSSLAASKPGLSDYAHSKHEGEQLLHDKPLLPWTVLRPPAVYGPGERELLPLLKMIRRGWLTRVGPPDQRLSLLHVDDLASAILSWLSAPQHCLHATYAIDDGRPGGYAWTDIGEAVSDRKFRVVQLPVVLLELAAKTNLLLSGALGYSPMLSPGKVRELTQTEWLCDNRAFTQATGWQPERDLKQGARQLFETESGRTAT